MEYTKCPLCGKKTSVNTINNSKKCTECSSQQTIESMLNSIECNEKYPEIWKNQYLGEYIRFIELSNYSNVWKARAILDFNRILEKIDKVKISEKELEENYYRMSPYKSPNMFETIKIFLFSKQMILFDIPFLQWMAVPLKNSYYYHPSILEYYFDDSKCLICGSVISSKHQSFCNDCITRKTLANFCKKVELEGTFTNDIARDYFKKFLNFLLASRLSFQRIYQMGSIAITIFQYLDSDINITSSKSIISLNGNIVQEIITPQWVLVTFSKLPISTYSKNKKDTVKPTLEYIIGFLENDEIILRRRFNPEIIVSEESVTVNINSKNSYQKIFEKIQTLPKGFQKLLTKYLEVQKNRNEILVKKNASKSLTWRTIDQEFYTIISLINWLVDNESITDWDVVTQDIINRYLLTFKKQKNRDIRKRQLFNFFEFGRKNKFLLQNPVPPFKARDYSINEKVFTRNDHKKLFTAIKQSSKTKPMDSLLASLCYFHVLTSKQIREIKLSDVDLVNCCIYLKGRAPAYLQDLEIHNLNNYLGIVEYDVDLYKPPYLFFNINKGRAVQINESWLNRHVKSIYNQPPSSLRRAGLQYCAEVFGPQYLHDCFGLSLSHTARFGDPDDRMIEDIIVDEITKRN